MKEKCWWKRLEKDWKTFTVGDLVSYVRKYKYVNTIFLQNVLKLRKRSEESL